MWKKAGDRIKTGTEHGVEWEIDSSKYDPVIVHVKSTGTGKEETVVYACLHKPIFGYDVEDSENVNLILDDLISKYANDGYDGLSTEQRNRIKEIYGRIEE